MPPFFLYRVGDGKRRQVQNQEVFQLNCVVLILTALYILIYYKGDDFQSGTETFLRIRSFLNHSQRSSDQVLEDANDV